MTKSSVAPMATRGRVGTAAPAAATSLPRERLLRRAEVEARTGLSCSALYRRIAAGTFPRPVPLGGGPVRWPESAIDAWIAARCAAGEGGGA